MYVSGSSDGSIKVWDGASNKCSLSFNRAHEGEEICSVLFSKNGKVHCSFNRLRESRIYWAAHVKTKFESLSILSISNILK